MEEDGRRRRRGGGESESESESLLSQYRFTRKFVLRCTVSDIINNNNLTRLKKKKRKKTDEEEEEEEEEEKQEGERERERFSLPGKQSTVSLLPLKQKLEQGNWPHNKTRPVRQERQHPLLDNSQQQGGGDGDFPDNTRQDKSKQDSTKDTEKRVPHLWPDRAKEGMDRVWIAQLTSQYTRKDHKKVQDSTRQNKTRRPTGDRETRPTCCLTDYSRTMEGLGGGGAVQTIQYTRQKHKTVQDSTRQDKTAHNSHREIPLHLLPE